MIVVIVDEGGQFTALKMMSWWRIMITFFHIPTSKLLCGEKQMAVYDSVTASSQSKFETTVSRLIDLTFVYCQVDDHDHA